MTEYRKARDIAAELVTLHQERIVPLREALAKEVWRAAVRAEIYATDSRIWESRYSRILSFVDGKPTVVMDGLTKDGVAVEDWADYDDRADKFFTFDELENIETLLKEDLYRLHAPDRKQAAKDARRTELLKQLEALDKED